MRESFLGSRNFLNEGKRLTKLGSWLLMGLGIILVVLGLAPPVIATQYSQLVDLTNRRILSFLADEGFFDATNLKDGTVESSPVNGGSSLSVINDVHGTSDRAVGEIHLLVRDNHAIEISDAWPPQVIGELKSELVKFSAESYPVHVDVIGAAYVKAARWDYDWATRFSVHHFGLPFRAWYGLVVLGVALFRPLLARIDSTLWALSWGPPLIGFGLIMWSRQRLRKRP